jgi:hypothetical protein
MTGVGGIEYQYTPLTAKVICEAYYKKYDRLPVDSSLLSADPYDKSPVLLAIGEGKSYGVELFLQKKLTRRFFGTLAWSLSRLYYRDMRPGHEGEWYPGDYDFRNGFTVTGGWKTDLIEKEWYTGMRRRWWVKALSPVFPFADRVELSAKWRFLGGRPYTAPVYNDSLDRWIYDQEELNGTRYPPYHRLDLRYERRYGFGFLQMIYYLDIQNVYNRKNIWTYLYRDGEEEPGTVYQIHAGNSMPFVLSGGVIIGF